MNSDLKLVEITDIGAGSAFFNDRDKLIGDIVFIKERFKHANGFSSVTIFRNKLVTQNKIFGNNYTCFEMKYKELL